ncbi:hypothetical protein KQI63_06645 [bacterium]|nr:hypothetical protein [bacterium]
MKFRLKPASAACFLPLLFAFAGCGNQDEKKATYSPDDPALAWVADDTIRMSEFSNRFRSTPHVGQGLSAAEGYLQAMLTEKLLAEMTREEGMASAPGIKDLVDQLHREAVVEAYLERELATLPPVGDSLIRVHLDRLDQDLLLNAWIFPDTLNAAEAFHKSAQSIPFSHVSNPSPNGVRFIEHQALSYNQSSPLFEQHCYNLRPGEVGIPLFLDGSWWLVQKVESRRSAAADSLRLSDKVNNVRGVIEKRQRQALQDALVARAMRGRSIDIEEAPFFTLTQELRALLPSTSQDDAPLTAQFNLAIPAAEMAEGSLHADDRPLVHLSGFDIDMWTVGEVVTKLAVSPRPLVNAPEPVLARRLRNEILFLAEFETLYQVAAKSDVVQSATVERESAMWRDHIQAQAGLRLLARRVGTVLPFDTPEKWDDASMAKTDTLIVNLLSSYGDSLGIGINRSLLTRVPTSEQPVILRKTHFPNRPMAPMPVGYRWGVLWSQIED